MLRTATTTFEPGKYPVKRLVRDLIFCFPSTARKLVAQLILPWVTAGYLFGSITLESIFLFFPIFVMIHDDVSYQ